MTDRPATLPLSQKGDLPFPLLTQSDVRLERRPEVLKKRCSRTDAGRWRPPDCREGQP
jgi:hypothetical protein